MVIQPVHVTTVERKSNSLPINQICSCGSCLCKNVYSSGPNGCDFFLNNKNGGNKLQGSSAHFSLGPSGPSFGGSIGGFDFKF